MEFTRRLRTTSITTLHADAWRVRRGTRNPNKWPRNLGTLRASWLRAVCPPRLPGAGLEPAWGYPRGIFLPTTAFAAARSAVARPPRRHAFVVWTLPSPCRVASGPAGLGG